MKNAEKINNRQILSTWKDISSYLDRNIRTCQRWEKEIGLPVYRMEESSRASVFAYRDEIDEWLHNRVKNNEIGQKSFFERKGAVIGTLLGLAVSVVVLAYFLIFHIFDEKLRAQRYNPTHIALNNEVVYFCDDSGKSLWDFKFSPEQGSRSFYLPPQTVDIRKLVDFADIDRDSRNEVVFFRLSDDLDKREFIVFDNDGQELFRKKFIPNQKYADMTLDYKGWRIDYLKMVDILGDEVPEILVIWKNQSRFPTTFLVYDKDGNEIFRYNHTGHLYRFDVFKNKDGQRFIYLFGTNNLLNGNAIFSVLNCDNLVSGTAPPYDIPEDLEDKREFLKKYLPIKPAKAVQEYYFRIAHNELVPFVSSGNRTKYLSPRNGKISDDGITFCIYVTGRSKLFYTLDSSYQIRSIIPNISFQNEWNVYYGQHEIHRSLDSFIKHAEDNIFYWHQSGWRSLTSKNGVQNLIN